MTSRKFIYNVNYAEYEQTLCAIEKRALFNSDLKEKVFFSDIEVDPSTSSYIKNRLSLLHHASKYEDLLMKIKQDETFESGFNIKYIKLVSGDPYAQKRNSLCKEIIALRSETPDYKSKGLVYGVTHFQDQWYFGVLMKNSRTWRVHDNRPYTYSNSLKMNMAKVLINLAGKGDLSKTIVDPCCGAGTVLLEGCFAGYAMTGADISWKTAKNARENLAHFGYDAPVYHRAIQNISAEFDCSVVDLPYGLYSQTTPEEQQDIIRNAKRISRRLVVISSEDISTMLRAEKLKVVDSCQYIKSINRRFTRYIYVCEHDV